MSQRSTANTSNVLTEENINAYTINMYKTILQLTALKLPIKKSDLVAIALSGNNKYFNEIFPIVKEKLKQVNVKKIFNIVKIFFIKNIYLNFFCIQIYGYTVNTDNDSKSVKLYFCTTKIGRITSPDISECDQSTETLLFLCLSYIFMKGGTVNLGFFMQNYFLYYILNFIIYSCRECFRIYTKFRDNH